MSEIFQALDVNSEGEVGRVCWESRRMPRAVNEAHCQSHLSDQRQIDFQVTCQVP